MAGILLYADSGDNTVTPGTNDPFTLIQLVPGTNQRILIRKVVVTTPKFTTGAAPTNETALVTLCRQGVLTTQTALTVQKIDQDMALTPRSTAYKSNAGESATNTIIGGADRICPAAGGTFIWEALRREDMIPINPGDTSSAFGIRVDPDHATTARDYRAQVWWEE